MHKIFTKIALVFGVSASVVGFMTYQQAYATSTPDSCFAFDSGTGTITDYYDHEANDPGNPACTRDVEIPTNIDGISVTNIGNSAFFGNRLTSVAIPSSVTSIDGGAFFANKIKSVTIPNSVTNIGNSAFYNNRIESITISGDPWAIGANAFKMNPVHTISYNGTLYTSSDPNDESCFEFDSSSGTITNFRIADIGLIKSDGQACLNRHLTIPDTIDGVSVTSIGHGAFDLVGLTSVTIPNSVTTIGYNAFARNNLTSVIIPNSVTTLEGGAFNDNQLTSVVIPDSITSIKDTTFVFNRLTDVTLPSSIQSVDITAFAGQNQWGGTVDLSSDPAHDLYSDDLSIVQNVYSNMWYARIYTANKANPDDLPDGIMSEWWWPGDVNKNGDQRDPVGGHLINPASVTIRYKDEQGHQLQAPVQYTGVRTNTNTHLTNYGIVDSAVKSPLDPYAPTPQEADELAAGFAQYYRSGQTKTFTPPSIAGYTAPAAKTVTFNPGENVLTFTYHKEGTPTVAVNGDKAITKTPTIPSRPTFSGVATPGATVVVTVHSDPITCTTTADSSGKWSCTLPESLPAGKHTVYVEVTNPDNSVQKLGPYSVIVREGSPTILAPDSGVAPLRHDTATWAQAALIAISSLSILLYILHAASSKKARD